MNPSVSQSGAPTSRALPARVAFALADAEATMRAGAALARALVPPLLITLTGDLGTGKTTLVRGVLRALGWTGPVKSPTYTLVEHYIFSSLYFYHFDLYRLDDPDEWASAGFGEYLSDRTVAVVEWPERAAVHLRCADLVIELAYPPGGPECGRDLVATAFSESGRACLDALQAAACPSPPR